LPEVLGGRYRIERLLGVGGMGAVYRARDLLREQFGDPAPWVALKTLNDDFAEYPDAHALLHGEYALTCRVHHAHVVRPFAFEVDFECQRAFLTLELLDGPTLDQFLADNPGGLAWPLFCEIAQPLLAALAAAHRQGILHGDIKPSNVVLARDGLRLIDFGLGETCHASLPHLSRQRVKAWTLRYAALELLDGGPLTPASDLYAVACVLYELSSGRHPYRRLSARQARAMDLERTLQAPPRLPVQCWSVLREALALAPERRLADIEALRRTFLETTGKRRWLRSAAASLLD